MRPGFVSKPRTESLGAALACAVACTVGGFSLQAHAADAGSEQGGVLYSVEKRSLMGSHELSVAVGTLPMDAFGKGLTLTGAYTFHFSQLVAWEIVGGTYSFIIGTGLDQELRDRFVAQAEEEGDLVAMLDSNFVFKPLYGKLAWLNDTLLAAELFFVAGPALGFYDDRASPFGANLGVGLRLFLGQYFALKLDIRDYLFVANFSDVRNHLFLSLGLSLTFGFSDDTEED